MKTYDYIFKTKFVDDMSKNGMRCRIIKEHTETTVPRYDIELEDGSKIRGVYAAEIQKW